MEKGGVGSKDNKSLDTYGRDTLNDNGKLLLSFANNYDLAIVNTFFSTPRGCEYALTTTSRMRTCGRRAVWRYPIEGCGDLLLTF